MRKEIRIVSVQTVSRFRMEQVARLGIHFPTNVLAHFPWTQTTHPRRDPLAPAAHMHITVGAGGFNPLNPTRPTAKGGICR